MTNKVIFTIASAGRQVLHGLTEGVTLSFVTPAVVNTHRVVLSICRRWTLTAVTCDVKERLRFLFFLIYTALLMFDQQEAITCAGGYAFAGCTDGLLAPCSCLLILAILTASAVSVTVGRSIKPALSIS